MMDKNILVMVDEYIATIGKVIVLFDQQVVDDSYKRALIRVLG